jgi:hypothetical protein
LLQHAENIGVGYHADIFAMLLDKGADIHARDITGRTCLHIAACKAGYRYKGDIRDNARAILLLIERGADISTLDYNGRSIFDDAYECDHGDPVPLGSYRGDLWDHVLIRSGHGERIRPPEERIYHYTERYIEYNFRLLWEGWEYLFPYSHQTSSPCPILILEDEDGEDEDGGDEDGEDEDGEDEDQDEQFRP